MLSPATEPAAPPPRAHIPSEKAAREAAFSTAVALPPAVAAAVWRGDQLGRVVTPTRPSGFAALDAELPGGGWPCRGLTELICRQPGTLEWRLLGPLLRTGPNPAEPVLLVGPPHAPHPPGLRADGIDERGLVWLQAHSTAERLWSTEQLLKARAPGVLVVWLPQARPEQLRRLQVLAGAARGPVFVCRPPAAAYEASAAPLRLAARVGAGFTLLVDLLKRPGPPLGRTLRLPSVPGGLTGCLPPRLRRGEAAAPLTPALSMPEAPSAAAHDPSHEAPHVVVRPAAVRTAHPH